MESAFSGHLEQLIQRLKTEILQHHERDLVACKSKQPSETEAFSKPYILGLQKKGGNDGPDFRRKMLMSRTSAPDSDSSEEPRSTMSTTQPRLASKTAVSEDSDASGSADSLELKTPKPGRGPRVPKPEGFHLFPHTPHSPPQMLEPQVFPVSHALVLPEDAVNLPHQPNNADHPQQPEVHKENEESFSSDNSSNSKTSASFSSTSTPNDEMPTGPPPQRRNAKRPSNASFSEFFKRQATVTDLYLFMQDEDSSKAAWVYAKFSNYFVTAAIIFTVWQANAQPVVPRFLEGGIQLGFEGLMLVELLAHFFSTRSGERRAFLKNPYNIIDFIAILPIALRIPFGIATPTKDENAAVHYMLYCFVPVVRQLKLIRKFQKLQLLLHVLSTTMDALKLLLFLVCLIVLVFGCAFYVLEPDTMDSLATSVYLCTVTVTTVGTCDMNPVTPVGKTMAGALCLTSVLFMAMPLSVLGNAMSQTWADRHRIVLISQTRRKLKNLGYTAEHMPKLFGKFDKDGNGELEMDEFCDLVAKMRIGMKPSEASELFLAFDENGDGGITEMEFMKALFPLDYRRIYRRQSGISFQAE
ncbi:unnamed protein product [Effrenium voratum]|uniref:EF-hand domain-containing protein n=1 Tax=Effrenium voratum TaxID=2562239 RepID=A0AA36MJA8_9DINO|nr:unnamed protein product [Effrenium voratum]CAJ1374429.1 unnamed protein product [Effrenium voratum]